MSPSQPRPAAVLFDFGGVVVASPFGVFTAVEQAAGLPSGFVRAVNSRDPDTNAWACIERGEIDADEFCRRFADEAAALGGDIDARAVLEPLLAATARQHAVPQMVDAALACRTAGVRTAVVTNNVVPLDDDPAGAWVFDTFDAVLQSCRLGTRKPEPQIYRAALEAVGAPAERTVMLDDLGINLKPARALGIHTIKVTDPVTAAAELLGLLADVVSH